MWQEFKDFALKGNAIAVAVGVVMGAAFNGVVNAIVKSIFDPIVGVIIGGANLNDAAFKVMGVSFGWGAVLSAVINFLVVALALFIIVKGVSKVVREPEPDEKDCPFCATQIPCAATRCPNCTSELAAQAG